MLFLIYYYSNFPKISYVDQVVKVHACLAMLKSSYWRIVMNPSRLVTFIVQYEEAKYMGACSF